jgi:alpha-D-xyloside xylohydrolase
MRNRYAVLYNNAVEELIQKDLKGNGVLFARSVTVGANGIGFLWGGDNEASFSPLNGLPTVVTAGLGAGLSGMPLWTADLGGYEATATTPDARLLMRWTEYAAFSPVMEVMSSANIGPWDFDAKWPGQHEALDVYRKYAVLHMSLFPYRYAAAQEAAKTGMPIMRALVLQYQDDARARTAKDEYLFGPDCWWRRWSMRARSGRCICRRASGWTTGRARMLRAARWWWRMRRWIRFQCGRARAR